MFICKMLQSLSQIFTVSLDFNSGAFFSSTNIQQHKNGVFGSKFTYLCSPLQIFEWKGGKVCCTALHPHYHRNVLQSAANIYQYRYIPVQISTTTNIYQCKYLPVQISTSTNIYQYKYTNVQQSDLKTYWAAQIVCLTQQWKVNTELYCTAHTAEKWTVPHFTNAISRLHCTNASIKPHSAQYRRAIKCTGLRRVQSLDCCETWNSVASREETDQLPGNLSGIYLWKSSWKSFNKAFWKSS